MILDVKVEPGPAVAVATMLAPKMSSLAAVVAADPLLALELFPNAPAVTSSGLVVLSPLYSRIRMSGTAGVWLNFTTTVFAPAAAATIFFA
jgi:hypothetical protein